MTFVPASAYCRDEACGMLLPCRRHPEQMRGDEDVPVDVRRTLLHAATAKGISYYWLIDVYLGNVAPVQALSDPPAVEPATMRLWCYGCGRDVSTPVPMGTIVRAWVQCPACMERWQPTPEEPAVEPVTACVGEVRDHENDGPLESTDLYVTGRGVSLLVNAVAGNRFTYALSVDGHDVQSGEVGAEEPAVEPREGDQRVRGTVREVWCVDCGSWEFDGHVQAVDPVPSSVWDAFRELDAAVVEWDRRDCDAEAPLIRENRVWSRIRRAVDIYRQAAQEPAAVPVQEQE